MTTGVQNIITEEKEPFAPDDHLSASASEATLEETPKPASTSKTKPPVLVTFESLSNTENTASLHERNRNWYCTSNICREVIIAAFTLAAMFLVVCFFYLPITSENNSVADALISTSKVFSSSGLATKTKTHSILKGAPPTTDNPVEHTTYHYGNLQVVSPNQSHVFSPLVNGYLISEIIRHVQASDKALKPYFGSDYRDTINEIREVYNHVFLLHGYTQTKILIDRKNEKTEVCHSSGISSGVAMCYGSGKEFSRKLKADFNVENSEDENSLDTPVASAEFFAYAFSIAQFSMPFASGRGALYGEIELKSSNFEPKFVDQLIFKTDMNINRYGKTNNIVSVPLWDPSYRFFATYNENLDNFIAVGCEELRRRLSVEGERIHGHFVIPKIEQKSLVTIKDLFGFKKITLDNNSAVFQNVIVGSNFSLTAEGVNIKETKKRHLLNRKDSIPLVHIQPPFEYGILYSKDKAYVLVAYGTFF